ncbi:hypothetical protein MPL3365_70072 [Mesorhizobium plurifarium]|uniref:Uncharacterized protein n=1 Tax=Mesorhizobium plurifarium TaxID=69974 RepID=A0A090GGU4_MESPL|nr:hypothetical protein MPL3365_70072 [Mesorhizobium plurifarium]
MEARQRERKVRVIGKCLVAWEWLEDGNAGTQLHQFNAQLLRRLVTHVTVPQRPNTVS